MIQFNRTRDDSTGAVWVMQRRFIDNALSALYKKFKEYVIICSLGVMDVWKLEEVISNYRATIYVIWVIVRPLLVMSLHSVFSWTSCINLHVCELDSCIGVVNISHFPHAAYIFISVHGSIIIWRYCRWCHLTLYITHIPCGCLLHAVLFPATTQSLVFALIHVSAVCFMHHQGVVIL